VIVTNNDDTSVEYGMKTTKISLVTQMMKEK